MPDATFARPGPATVCRLEERTGRQRATSRAGSGCSRVGSSIPISGAVAVAASAFSATPSSSGRATTVGLVPDHAEHHPPKPEERPLPRRAAPTQQPRIPGRAPRSHRRHHRCDSERLLGEMSMCGVTGGAGTGTSTSSTSPGSVTAPVQPGCSWSSAAPSRRSRPAR